MHFLSTGKPVSAAVQIIYLHLSLFSHSFHTLSLIIIFRCFRQPLPPPPPPILVTAGAPFWVLLLAPAQPLHLKCLGVLSLLHLFYIHHCSASLTPLTNPSALTLPLTLLHPLLSLTAQIHLWGV